MSTFYTVSIRGLGTLTVASLDSRGGRPEAAAATLRGAPLLRCPLTYHAPFHPTFSLGHSEKVDDKN
jgi:hypothetical protein